MGNSNGINQNFAKIKTILDKLSQLKDVNLILEDFEKNSLEFRSEFNQAFKQFSVLTNNGKCSQKYKNKAKKIYNWFQIYKKDIESAIKKDISAKQKARDLIINNTDKLNQFGLESEYIYDFIENKIPTYFESFKTQHTGFAELSKLDRLARGYETTIKDTKYDQLNAEDEYIELTDEDIIPSKEEDEDDALPINDLTEINPVKTTLNIRKTLEILNTYVSKIKEKIKKIIDINLRFYNYKEKIYALISNNDNYNSYNDIDHEKILLAFQDKLSKKNYAIKYLFALLSDSNKIIKDNSLYDRRSEYLSLLRTSMEFLPKKILDRISSKVFKKPIDELIENAPNFTPPKKSRPETKTRKQQLPTKYFGPNAGVPISNPEKKELMERLQHQDEINRVLKLVEKQDAQEQETAVTAVSNGKLSVAQQLLLWDK